MSDPIHPSTGFNFGALTRPIHIQLADRTLFWEINDCGGLNDPDYNVILRTAAEMDVFAVYLARVDSNWKRYARMCDLTFNMPGLSMEFEHESNADYDATALDVNCCKVDDFFFVGVTLEAVDPSIEYEPDLSRHYQSLTRADVRLLSVRLKTLATAWADGTLKLKNQHPLGRP